MDQLTLQTTYDLICCSMDGCGMTFAVPSTWRQARLEDHATFYCPNGHQRYYPGLSDKERAERDLQRERAAHDQTKAEARMLRASRNAIKGQLTKTKRRVGKGVCPCCNRFFRQLKGHMAAKHPDYVEA